MVRNFRNILWSPFSVVFITFLLHLSYINTGFVWLDHGDIEGRRAIILSFPELLSAFFSRFGETGFYRPIVSILLRIEYSLFGLWAPGYHIVNILLHCGLVFTSFYFFKRFFTFTEKQAWIASLIVGIHPLSWFTVGTIASMPDLLATLFTLAAIVFYIESRDKAFSKDEKRRSQLLFFFVSFLAFLSKETALVLIPGLVFIWELTLSRQLVIKRIQNNKLLLIGLLVIYCSYFTLRTIAVPEVWRVPSHDLPLSQAIGTRLSATARTMFALITPLPSRISDATPLVGILHEKALLMSLILATCIWMLWRKKLQTTTSKIILFMVLALSPQLNIIPLPRFWTTNYGYFAIIGVGAIISLLLGWCWKKKSILAKSVQVGIVVWVILAATSTARAGLKLADDRSLFEEEVKQDVHFREGAYYLGNYYRREGALDRSASYFKQALANTPAVIAYVDQTSARINMAGVLLSQGKTPEAEQELNEALIMASGENERLARYNLAIMAQQKGDYEQVVELLDRYITDWDQQEAWLLLLKAFVSLGREEDTKRTLKDAWPYLDREYQTKLAPFLGE